MKLMFAGDISAREESSEDDLEEQEEGRRLSSGSEPIERLVQNARTEIAGKF